MKKLIACLLIITTILANITMLISAESNNSVQMEPKKNESLLELYSENGITP